MSEQAFTNWTYNTDFDLDDDLYDYLKILDKKTGKYVVKYHIDDPFIINDVIGLTDGLLIAENIIKIKGLIYKILEALKEYYFERFDLIAVEGPEWRDNSPRDISLIFNDDKGRPDEEDEVNNYYKIQNYLWTYWDAINGKYGGWHMNIKYIKHAVLRLRKIKVDDAKLIGLFEELIRYGEESAVYCSDYLV
jgi:hypothetical protein